MAPNSLVKSCPESRISGLGRPNTSFLPEEAAEKGDAVTISPAALHKMKFKQVARRDLRGSQLAYTLAEVVVCVALIVILFVGLLGGMSTGFALTQGSRENL